MGGVLVLSLGVPAVYPVGNISFGFFFFTTLFAFIDDTAIGNS